MLTADQIEVLGHQAQKLLDPVQDFLIREIASRITEAGSMTATAQYQVWRLQNMGKSQKEIKREVARLLRLSEEKLEQLIMKAGEDGYTYDLAALPSTSAVPFSESKVMQDIVSAAVDLARDDLTNISQTMGFCLDAKGKVCLPLTEAYEQACDNAFMKVSTGAQDFQSAVREATRGLAKKGIQYIDYESGIHTTLEAATRRSIMGGMGLMQEKISQSVHDECGCNGWEISAHGCSAPDHEPYQGRQYSDAEFQKLNNSLKRRIGTLNCGHAAHPIILGISRPQYTEQELRSFREENQKGVDIDDRHYTGYEATQKQRTIERAMRAKKKEIIVAEATGDPNLPQLQSRMQVLSQEYSRFSNQAGLRTQIERTHVNRHLGKSKPAPGSSLDFMGKPQNFNIKKGNGKVGMARGYEVDGHPGFFSQTYSKDARATIDFIEKEKENIPQLTTVDEIVVTNDIYGPAAYDHEHNRLYVDERLTNPEFIKSDVANGYFVAENAEDTLRHEMHHKEHHDLIDRRLLTSHKDRATVKQEIEADLRKYVVTQWLNERNYITKYVSENASVAFVRYNSLNELIAEVMLANDKGIIKDPILVRKVGEMFHDAHDVG